ncbi:MAG TPA: hypothetical protein VGO31_06645 [Microbacteriaceae bacterium]|nr:hypothetical protein [Microbacteriaceae bacterium]
MRRGFISAVLALVSIGGVLTACGEKHAVRFDSTAWRQPVGYCVPSARQRMARAASSFVNSSAGRGEVRELLGAPESTSDGDWFYMVGANSDGLLTECVFLRVHFGGEHPSASIETDS